MSNVVFVGVCGGRGYWDRAIVSEAMLNTVRDFAGDMVIIVHGAARGADTLAGEEARKMRLHVIPVQALWAVYAKRAGIIRNGIIAALPLRRLLAFPGGVGTADMVRRAEAAGIEVVRL